MKRHAFGVRTNAAERPGQPAFLHFGDSDMGGTMFSAPDQFMLDGMDAVCEGVDKIFPAPKRHLGDVPAACRDLSALLTADRDEMGRSYWLAPRLAAAYLRYFLPWNLVRLCALLPSLPLGDVPLSPVAADAGSGPLTFPMALWLSRPELRRLPLTFICADSAPQPLKYGMKLFEHLRGRLEPSSPWKMVPQRGDISALPSMVREKMWLLSFCNVLNECGGRKRTETLASAVRFAAGRLLPGGMLLCVEPGTRLGARTVSDLRSMCLGGTSAGKTDREDASHGRADRESFGAGPQRLEDYDPGTARFTVSSPCTHQGRCPLGAHSGQAWCHFRFTPQEIPRKLSALSEEAGLAKQSLSLSFVLMRKSGDAGCPDFPAGGAQIPARVVSDGIWLPGFPGRARYACSEKGLLLMTGAEGLPSGMLAEAAIPGPERRDAKSGALMAVPAGGCRQVPRGSGPGSVIGPGAMPGLPPTSAYAFVSERAPAAPAFFGGNGTVRPAARKSVMDPERGTRACRGDGGSGKTRRGKHHEKAYFGKTGGGR